MRLKSVVAGIASSLLLSAPAGAQLPTPTPAASRISAPASTGPSSFLPVVGMILEHESELGLTSAQVEGLERLGLGVVRETIRRRADLMIAELDLSVLVDRSPTEAIDMATIETKIREVERIRADFHLAFVRAIEAAKNQLTPEQRSKLTTLVASADREPIDPASQPGDVDAARGATGAAPRPGGGGAHHPAPGAPRPHGDHHGRPHGHVFIGVGPWWFGAPYPYWDYPGWAYEQPPVTVEPPVYIQQPPPPAPYWYYCPSSNAYYPTVPTCPEPWVLVPPRAG